jgi:hypothetical protein
MTFGKLLTATLTFRAFVTKAGDICIAGDSGVNTLCLGTYSQASDLDANQNTYYVKPRCDGTNDFLYQNGGNWQTSTTKNGNSYYLRCPEDTASPEDCTAGTWLNAGNTDASLTVTTGSCPSSSPSISCDAVYIDVADSRCAGYFDKVEEGLYQNACGKYFYYNGYFQEWQCGPKDERDVCDAWDQDNTWHVASTDPQLDTLSAGTSPITAALDYPSGTNAGFYCDAEPQIACNFMEIKNVGNGNDGLWQKAADQANLFTKDGKYFFYEPVGGSTVTASNPLDSCTSLTAYFRSSDTAFGSLSAGDTDVSFTVTHPTGVNGATVSCLADPPTPAPTEQPGDDDLCVAVVSWFNKSPYNYQSAGKYKPIENVNGYPAYQLYGCEADYGASVERYLWYSSYYQAYRITDAKGSGNRFFSSFNNAQTPIDSNGAWSPTLPDGTMLMEVSLAATRPGGCGCDSEPLGAAVPPGDVVPFENNEPETGVWTKYLQMLASDQASSVITVLFLIMCACNVAMCAYCMGYTHGKRTGSPGNGTFAYSKAKVVFDHEEDL